MTTLAVLIVVLFCLYRWTHLTMGALALSALGYAVVCWYFNLDPYVKF